MTKLTSLGLTNRLIVGLVTLAIVIFGLLAAFSLRQELVPSTQIPTGRVTASYPGASPDVVAAEIGDPLERAVAGVEGVTSVRATSVDGLARLSVEWEYGTDTDTVVADITAAAEGVPNLPDDIDIRVEPVTTDNLPVLTLAVTSDLPAEQLGREVNDTVVPRVTDLTGVREVQVTGDQVSELAITLRPSELRAYDLTAAGVTQTLQSRARSIPAGTASADGNTLSITVGRTVTSVKTVSNWPIPAADGPARLSQIADVQLQAVESSTLARSDGRPALSLNVLRALDADAVEVSRAVRAELPALAEAIGENASLVVVSDQAPQIEESIKDLLIEGALGLTFAVVVILIFLLSVRSTLITAISMPLSLLIAMIGLQIADYSLNVLTLAAMTVAIGRVVDDSIVVTENIKRRDTGPAHAADRARAVQAG